ncbi:CDP-diacylglycerol--glycerol-3-phosphate 3-phosphatidyltransferase, mitochondrial isoform X2 [Ischnura elegans]|uniref:CDP-diacylglycerol--glycerol-3-phosphate 3-phosphatidyltransferase, mitochondrial isoform X2 n=1 Tax=Ischnura elegans TaxID=197161 RepID=UPI001ED8B0D0|nr:CDP-diacylglycerol--glycerol-3-phosphate 3-phosphatidyltransferase, mitochondrial isoform X2 [Ischnura elegans]
MYLLRLAASYLIYLKMYFRGIFSQERSGISSRNFMSQIVNQRDSQKTDTFEWLDSLAMKFGLNGNKVTIIHEPSDFYQTLLDKCRSSRRRITLASLYLGTGSLERKLVEAIGDRLSESTKEEQPLKVKVLLDCNRGSRGKENSRTLLSPLVKLYPGYCQVALYRTPILNGVLGNIIPQRWNEVFGLQHMKIYLFDDSLIISGANLSNDYFTNRQDRYMLVEDCPQLADFYDGLVSCVSNFSYALKASESSANKDFAEVSHSMSPGKELLQFYRNYKVGRGQELAKEECDTSLDTWIYPLIEAGQLGVHQDSKVTEMLLKSVPHGSTFHLTTGYFNLTSKYSDAILQQSVANYHVLMAHPTANGFLNAKGIAGSIPAAYTLIARTFFHKVLESCGNNGRIGLWEYCRDGWTFHAKGLWFTPGTSSLLPSLTLIGSPNFGYRSVERDLETQIALITHNSGLQKRLAEERDRLYARAPEKVSEATFSLPGRYVPFWVRCFVWFFRSYF